MKKNFFKNLILPIIVFLSTGLCISCSSNYRNKDDGTIIIGLDETFVPMGFRDEKGTIIGFDVDLATEAFKRLGLKFKFQPIDWSMKESELINNNIDVIWNGYSITKARENKVAFTNPYLQNKQVIMTLINSNIQSKDDLNNKSVSTQDGSSSLDALNKEPDLIKKFKHSQPILFETYTEALIDLETGRSDAIIIDEILAKYYMQKRGQSKYKILQDNFDKEAYSIGLRKNDTNLLNNLNSILNKMKKDGTMTSLCKKWFGEDITQN